MMRAFALSALLLLATANPVFAAKGNGGPSPAAQMQSSRAGGGGGGGHAYMDPRKAPPLDPARKVNEQDCSKPLELFSGNLKCK
jgi:hypothetical protein